MARESLQADQYGHQELEVGLEDTEKGHRDVAGSLQCQRGGELH